MRRRLAVAAGVAVIVIGAGSIAIKSDALDRVAGVAGEAVAWLRSAPAPETPVPAALPHTTMAVPVAAPKPPAARSVAPSEPPPARPSKLAPPPAQTDPTPPVKAEARPEPKHEMKMEAKLEPKRESTAAAVTEAPAEFSGVPRLEMRRVRDAAGHTSAIAVRVTDAGGRPLRSADVRILRRLNGGGIQEVRLTPDAVDGSFRGAFPAPSAKSDGLSMRVTVGRVSHEVPIAE